MNPNVNANPAVDPPFSPPSPPLQRGKACLSCRRRKMKCDGARPICTPCLRGERAEDCEYTDGQHRPRMLTLEEDIARLRARVWELENPGQAMPAVELYAPYVGASAATSARQAQPHIQAPSLAPHHHPVGTLSSGPLNDELRQPDFRVEVQVDVQRALSAVAPYAAELGFFLDLDRLRVQGTHVLPALQSALALWSVQIASVSGPDDAHASEGTPALSSRLLSQAQAQHAAALGTVDAEPDPAIFLHVIQTGVLLAYYMQRIGQVVGARYYASGTWALGALLKLHQNPYLPVGDGEGQCAALRGSRAGEGSTHGNANPCAFAFMGCTGLPPALDGIEAEERVRAFWTVYALDRWFCAIGHGPCQSLAMDGSTGNAMTVPWPGVGGTNEARPDVVRRLLDDPSHDFTQDDPSAMYAKASVLLGEATMVAASFVADNTICQSPGFRARFGTLDTLLGRCLAAAMTMATASRGRPSQTQPGQPGQGQALVTVHLVALAHVTLHRPFISTYGHSRRRCVEGAMGAVRVLEQMGESVAGAGTCPTYPIVWTALCVALHDEVLRLRARPDADPSRRREEGEMISAIRKLVGMLSALSQHCPSRFFAAKIEAVLPILESIAV